jgi:hypothetical protein
MCVTRVTICGSWVSPRCDSTLGPGTAPFGCLLTAGWVHSAFELFLVSIGFKSTRTSMRRQVRYPTSIKTVCSSSLAGWSMASLKVVRTSSPNHIRVFGKNFSGIFNLIDYYILRFIILGVLLMLILYPIAIFLNSAISFVFAITG